MLFVVVAMLSMLGLMALAIDVITLYSARNETQRAAVLNGPRCSSFGSDPGAL